MHGLGQGCGSKALRERSGSNGLNATLLTREILDNLPNSPKASLKIVRKGAGSWLRHSSSFSPNRRETARPALSP
jgi:hypothetical protein